MLKCRLLFYQLLKALGDYHIVPYMAEFGMIRRHVRDVIVSGKNTFPFLRAEIGFGGFRIEGVPYRREARTSGQSNYNFWGNFRFAVAGILSSTTFPLRASSAMMRGPAARNINPSCTTGVIREVAPSAKGLDTQAAPRLAMDLRLI